MTDVAVEPSNKPQAVPLAEAQATVVQEYFDSAGQSLRSDPGQGVLRGVKLLGLRSRNGRRYAEAALREAMGLYEGSKVNVNHPERDPLAPRDYRDRLGVVRNVRFERQTGLYGDLHYNPKHALAEQLAWDAEHAPENVGLSHNVLARTRRESDGIVVEAITRVQSVDLVADPATTAGLFEQRESTPCETGLSTGEPQECLERENDSLREEIKQLRAQQAREQRRDLIDRLIAEQRVDEQAAGAVMSEAFVRQLMQADEAELAEMVEDRTQLVRKIAGDRLPRSREQSLAVGPEAATDTASFVAAVSRRG